MPCLCFPGFLPGNMGIRAAKRKPRTTPLPPHAQSASEGEVAVATPWCAGVSRAPRQKLRRPEGVKLRNQLPDPVGQGEGGGVDGWIVIVGLQLGFLIGLGSPLDALF